MAVGLSGTDTEVVQGSSQTYDLVVKISLPIPVFVFHAATTLHSANGVLIDNSCRSKQRIVVVPEKV